MHTSGDATGEDAAEGGLGKVPGGAALCATASLKGAHAFDLVFLLINIENDRKCFPLMLEQLRIAQIYPML